MDALDLNQRLRGNSIKYLKIALLCFIFALSLTNAKEAQAETLHDVISATWPADEVAYAEAIAYRESGGVANAYNPYSGSYCLFQFLPSTAYYIGADYASLANPYYCSAQAARLQNMMGWSPWAGYTSPYAYYGYAYYTPIRYY